MMETKGLMPNCNSDSYQLLHESQSGINNTSTANVEIGQDSVLVEDSSEEMEKFKNVIENAINLKTEATKKGDIDNTQEGLETSIDIVKALVEDAIVPKIIQDDVSESSRNAKDIVQNVVEEILVSNVVKCDNSYKGNDANGADKNVNIITRKVEARNSIDESCAITKPGKNEAALQLDGNSIDYNVKSFESSSLVVKQLDSIKGSLEVDKVSAKIVSDEVTNAKGEPIIDASCSDVTKGAPQIVDLSSEEEKDRHSEHTSNTDTSDEEKGDSGKPPGENAARSIDPDHLLPFHHGWKREVIMKVLTKNSATQYEIYYIPPVDSPYRTRESKRKRKSKRDQERYFDDFPHSQLSVQNFSYVPRPLGLNNAAYEIIRKPRKSQRVTEIEGNSIKDSPSPSKFGRKSMGGVSYKEIEETTGLLESESSADEDDEVRLINGFDIALPLSGQVKNNLSGMKTQYRKRRKYRNPETCCTPPLAEDMLWSALDDDPLGIYHELGGRSSPTTPPPLRAVRLTPCDTAIKIASCLENVKNEAAKHQYLKEQELADGYLASHDIAIKKYKNVKEQHYRLAFARNKMGQLLRAGQSSYQPKSEQNKTKAASYLSPNRHNYNLLNGTQYPASRISADRRLLTNNPANDRFRAFNNKHQSNDLVVRKTACGLNCPGVGRVQPTMQCISCQSFYHAKCQGVSTHVKVFKCRACVAASAQSSSLVSPHSNVVRVKLPMVPVNGKRPIVELVMMQGGKYQPIKFSNNMQVTEVISKRVFDQANNMKKTIYQRAKQVPNVGNRPIYLAVNPSNPATGNALKQQHKSESSSHKNPISNNMNPLTSTNPNSDQVSILVKQQHSGPHSKPVLLNVPRKVALKVKTGTTLSFSASNDQKYVVIDNKIHPPVKMSGQSVSQPRPAIPGNRPAGQVVNPSKRSTTQVTNLKSSNKTQVHIPPNLPKGLSIQRALAPHAPHGGSSNIPQQLVNRRRIAGSSTASPPNKVPRSSSNVLASGEIRSSAQSVAMNPCTPYCPGVNGFPELECTGCQSLFHSKCVGIPQASIPRLLATWKCRMCTSQTSGTLPVPKRPNMHVQVIELD